MKSIRYDVKEPVFNSRGVQLMYASISRYDSSWVSVLHSHSYAELFYVTRGGGTLQIGNERFPLAPNDCFLINPNVMHTEFSSATDPLEYIVIGLKRVTFHGDGRESRYSIVGDRSNQRVLLPYFQDILRELSLTRIGYLEVCAGILDILLLKIERKARMDIAAEDTEQVSSACATAKRFIDNHFQEQVTLDELAQQVGVSKYYLSRSFRSSFGVPLMQYLCHRLVLEAQYLLSTTVHSQDVVAMLTGFSSPSYFTQAFKRSTGMTPSDYRRTLHTARNTKAKEPRNT